jgi:hypothetical protein
MFGLCKYKNMIGEPNTGLRKKYRLFDVAVIDVSVTLIASVLLGYFMKWNIPRTVVLVFLAGIVAHRVFCVRTTFDKWLFPN